MLTFKKYIAKYIPISHWLHMMVDGTEFWNICKLPAFLSNFSRLQVIQNSAPSTIVWCQCDIQLGLQNELLYRGPGHIVEN